jgi:hypothetical protein
MEKEEFIRRYGIAAYDRIIQIALFLRESGLNINTIDRREVVRLLLSSS